MTSPRASHDPHIEGRREPSRARRLWAAIEPIHATVYFDPAPATALKDAGCRGWWMAYFAGRFGPLGAVTPGPATAIGFGFAPRMVARSLPDAWAHISPNDAVAVWSQAAGAALHQHLAGIDHDLIAELNELLAHAVAACRCDGRPLAAAWHDVATTGEAFTDLWLRATALREHRGDGHVVAAVSAGLSGLEATLTNIPTGAATREVTQPNRGWTDDEWDAAIDVLCDRNILDAGGRLTETGQQLRDELEATTNALAAGPVDHLGDIRAERAVELATILSRHLVDSGVVPIPNPIGVPRP